MSYFVPSYSFSSHQEKRTFHHRWHISDGQTYECSACCSTLSRSDSYSKHWAKSSNQQQISQQQIEQLASIDKQNIQRFLLCDSKAIRSKNNAVSEAESKHRFVLIAGMEAIPQFLQLMFQGADELTLQLGLHVSMSLLQVCETLTKELLFQSSMLPLRTHYDIKESLDTLLTMLLERIECQLRVSPNGRVLDSYVVKRIELQVQRIKWSEKMLQGKQAALPLQYSIKRACFEQKDANLIESRRLRSLSLKANYYGFHTCAISGELFVVPLILQPTALMPAINVPNVIMISDVNGDPQDLLLIRNLAKFLCHNVADCVLSCPRCAAKFMQLTQLVLHKRLKCGRDFKIVEMPADRVEIYEHCLPLQSKALNWPIFGIAEPILR